MVPNLDFIICHGYVYNEDGTMDPILKQRLDFSLELYHKGFSSNIILAGKYGQRDKLLYEETNLTQSAKMKGYCLQYGIPSKAIYEEPDGTNTFDCTKFTYERIILPFKWTSGIIVSSHEHMPRIILQTMKIFPPEFILLYSGPSIEDFVEREKFIAHEKEAMKYTLSRND